MDELEPGVKIAKDTVDKLKEEKKKKAEKLKKLASNDEQEQSKNSNSSKHSGGIVAAVCCILVFILLLLMVTPLAMYEGIQALIDQIEFEWSSASDLSGYWDALKGTFSAAGDYFTRAWKSCTSIFTLNSEGKRDADVMSDDDLTLFESEDSYDSLMQRKFDATKDKLDTRVNEIADKIEGSYAIKAYFISRFNSEYGASVKYSYDGTTIMVYRDAATDAEALKLMSLYTVMYQNDYEQAKVSAYMKWLGYYDPFAKNKIKFNVGGDDGVDFSVDAWSGSFMPQYLVDESLQNLDKDYSQYGCSAIDLLIYVSGTDFNLIQATETPRQKYIGSYYIGGTEQEPDITKEKTLFAMYYAANCEFTRKYSDADVVLSSLLDLESQKVYRDPDIDGTPMTVAGQKVDVYATVYDVSYSVSCAVTIRSVDEIVELVGWKKTDLGTASGGSLSVQAGSYLSKYKDSTTNDYLDYYVHIPENATTDMPLIIFLHGDGSVGNVGSLKNCAIAEQARSMNNGEFGFILLTPCTHTYSWTNSSVETTLWHLIESVVEEYECDPDRIIITGHSRGAEGAWNMVDDHPGYFSCCVPISCPWSITPSNFTDVAVRAYAGYTISGDVQSESSYASRMQSMVNNINKAGGKAEFKRLSCGHSQTDTKAYTKSLIRWMLEQ